MPAYDYPVYLFLIAGAVLSIFTRKLTPAGAITGAIVGLLIYKGAGYTGITMLALFFIAGSAATGFNRKQKDQIVAETKEPGRRTAAQVIANGGVAALLGLFGWLHPAYLPIALLMMAGSLASATADTLSSELGTIYGKRFYNVLTLKEDKQGLDGVISLEGTLIGVAGAFLIATVYAIGLGWSSNLLLIVIAGVAGNLTDSILGASLERRGLMKNNTVNFLNTLTGALVCLLMIKLLSI